ncbi:MAG: Nif11-like leader peptide family natural product precursor [Prochloraceae cyanobacterium]|nr:Nif11-like leader peptide family natural product precursor [Prochloraceae cyanobacterium]
MSVQSLSEFMNKLVEDESLQKEIESVTANKEEGMPPSQAIADLGIKHGYDFTEEELIAVVEEMEQLKAKEAEMSEEDLEAVAGGCYFPYKPYPSRPGIPFDFSKFIAKQ